MCNPPLDGLSIGSAKNYTSTLDVHYSSGIYNKAFCLLAKTPAWSTKTAFQAFARANQNFWTPSETFISGAKGVYSAACDLGLDSNAVVSAFGAVDVIVDTITNPCANTPEVNTPPVVSLSVPLNGAVVYGSAVNLAAIATDNLFVSSVEFFVDNASIGKGTIQGGVWAISWNSVLAVDGVYSITAKAKDNADLSTISSPITINVNNNAIFILAVSKSGLGSGAVAGGNISCGTICSSSLKVGTLVSLIATPAVGSAFGGWSGNAGRSGTGACSVIIDAAKNVT
jgi:hypothetical protein